MDLHCGAGALIRIQIAPRMYGSVSMMDLHDDWVENAVHGLKEGTFVRCDATRLLSLILWHSQILTMTRQTVLPCWVGCVNHSPSHNLVADSDVCCSLSQYDNRVLWTRVMASQEGEGRAVLGGTGAAFWTTLSQACRRSVPRKEQARRGSGRRREAGRRRPAMTSSS